MSQTSDAMRKSLLSVFIGTFSILPALAQDVTVEPSIENLARGYNSAYRLTIPHATLADAEREWKAFLKLHNAKVKGSRGQITGEDAVLHSLGKDTMQIYSSLSQENDAAVVKVAVQDRTDFISRSGSPDKSKQLELLLHRFGVETAKKSLASRIESAEKDLSTARRDHERLLKTNERLSATNETLKKQIEQNENSISDNLGKAESLQSELERRESEHKALREKQNDLN
ncbi:MAG: hypothetical protein ACKORE_07325 [Bacteroidota bacterium]